MIKIITWSTLIHESHRYRGHWSKLKAVTSLLCTNQSMSSEHIMHLLLVIATCWTRINWFWTLNTNMWSSSLEFIFYKKNLHWKLWIICGKYTKILFNNIHKLKVIKRKYNNRVNQKCYITFGCSVICWFRRTL